MLLFLVSSYYYYYKRILLKWHKIEITTRTLYRVLETSVMSTTCYLSLHARFSRRGNTFVIFHGFQATVVKKRALSAGNELRALWCRCFSGVGTQRQQQKAPFGNKWRRCRQRVPARHVPDAPVVHVVQGAPRIVYGSVSFLIGRVLCKRNCYKRRVKSMLVLSCRWFII